MTTTRAFLRMLHRGGGYTYWWENPGKISIWWPVDEPAPLPRGQRNLYVGVNPVAHIPTANLHGEVKPPSELRGQNALISSIATLYAEFDAKDFDDDLAAVLDHIEVGFSEIGVPQPSVLIESGGGYHAYWLLSEPWVFADDAERKAAQRLQAGWVPFVGGDTSVKDLARVLRVPGTVNYKYDPPRPVEFVQCDLDRVFDREQLAALLPMEEAQPAPIGSRLIVGTDSDAIRRWCVKALEGEQEKMRACGDGIRHDQRIRSAYALAGLLHSGGLTEQEIYDALLVNPGRDGVKEAERCIRDAIAAGRLAPREVRLTLPDPPVINADGFVCCPLHPTRPLRRGKTSGVYCTARVGASWCMYQWFERLDVTLIAPFPLPSAPQLVTAASPEQEQVQLSELIDAPATDAGNAECLALLYGDSLRYCHTRAKWLEWDGARWQVDVDGAAPRAALTVARARQALVAQITGDPDTVAERKKKAFAWALGSESQTKRTALLTTASILPAFATTVDRYDQDRYLAGLPNGTLDLRAGVIRPASREDYLTAQLGTAYDPEATCPRWDQFLREVFNDDQELIAYIQRAVGYTLTGDTREEVLFLCYGHGANGKSKFLEVLRRLLGDYAATASFETFDSGRRNESTNDLAALKSARLVTAIESDEDRRLAEARVKAVTGQDPITCRFLYQEHFTYLPQFKIWLAMNHKPVITGTDNGIWRRIRLIPFTQSFEGARRDHDLITKLLAELPGILNWALVGLAVWREHGLGAAPAIEQATADYRAESDLVAQWIDECAETDPAATLDNDPAYTSYRSWCLRNGFRPPSKKSLACRLDELGYLPGRTGKKRFRWGLRLTEEEMTRVTDWAAFGGNSLNTSSTRDFPKKELNTSSSSYIPQAGDDGGQHDQRLQLSIRTFMRQQRWDDARAKIDQLHDDDTRHRWLTHLASTQQALTAQGGA